VTGGTALVLKSKIKGNNTVSEKDDKGKGIEPRRISERVLGKEDKEDLARGGGGGIKPSEDMLVLAE